jgi:hypothetical protein
MPESKRARWALVLTLIVGAAALSYGLYLSLDHVTEHQPLHTGADNAALIQPHAQEIYARMKKGEPQEDIVQDLARRLGVPPEHVRGFIRAGADLKYYRIVVERSHDGEDYYDVAYEQLPNWGFPIGSPFNWRLPTYAYVLGALPGARWIQAVLTLIAAAGLVLTFQGESKDVGPLLAAANVALLVGVATWPLGGEAYFAQEVWAGMLILLSIGAAACAVLSPYWRILAVAAGLAALAFRELALPYCFFGGVVAFWYGRRREALAWLIGIGFFGLYLWWHMGQVHARLGPVDRAEGLGLTSWVQYGGLAFDIMATRMNAFLLPLPGWIVFLYLFLAIIGLLGWQSDLGRLLLLTTVTYLVSFAIIGRSMNFNWGLMFAPFLPFGVVRAPRTIHELIRTVRRTSAGDEEIKRLKKLAEQSDEHIREPDERIQPLKPSEPADTSAPREQVD